MKIILWGVFVLVALLWTGGAALLAQLVQWSAQGLADGGGASIGVAASTMAMPSWLSPWIDASVWAAMQQAAASVLASTAGALPAIGDAVAWLVPAVWVIWGLGMLALLGLTIAAMWLMRRFGNAVRIHPQPV
jgi:hypothetical protein